MFRYSKAKGRANFGTLGAEDDVDAETEKENPDKKSDSTGLLSTSTTAGGGGILGGMGSLCSCANKDKQAENDKRTELAQKYPLRDCGPSPTLECLAYNKRMVDLQNKEFDDWKASKDAQTGAALVPSDQQRFAFVAKLAQALKAAHPEAGGMTLSQIHKLYPDDFDKIYATLQGQFPFLKNIDADTALAMNPGIANMTLDELIAKTSALAGPAAPASTSGSSMALGIGALVAGGIGLLMLLKKRD